MGWLWYLGQHLKVDENIRQGIIIRQGALLAVHQQLLCQLQLPQPAAATQKDQRRHPSKHDGRHAISGSTPRQGVGVAADVLPESDLAVDVAC